MKLYEKIKTNFSNKMFISFFLMNLLIVAFSQLIILLMFNGSLENEYPWNLFFGMILISIFIFLIQYPLLKLKHNWFYRTFIFYLSMVLFLFFYGMLQSVLIMDRKTLSDFVEDGLKMMLIGQIVGLQFFPAIVIFNWMLRKKTLDYSAST